MFHVGNLFSLAINAVFEGVRIEPLIDKADALSIAGPRAKRQAWETRAILIVGQARGELTAVFLT